MTVENPTTNPEPEHQPVTMFTMPVTTLGSDAATSAAGTEALGVRFTLTDGRTVEVSRILLSPQNAIVIWPDGTANRTDGARPT